MEAFGIESGKRGRKTPIDKPPVPIAEIMEIRPDGHYYCTQSLAVATSIAIQITENVLWNVVCEMTEPEFIKYMAQSSLFFPYIRYFGPLLLRMFTMICYETIAKGHSHPKIASILLEERREMTIGKMRELNHQYFKDELMTFMSRPLPPERFTVNMQTPPLLQ